MNSNRGIDYVLANPEESINLIANIFGVGSSTLHKWFVIKLVVITIIYILFIDKKTKNA